MVPYLGCEHAREMLQAFIDGELPVEEQVAVEAHLRWCRTCMAHIEDLRVIGDSIRLAATGVRSEVQQRELALLQADVLSRVRAEEAQSFAAQLRSLFDDRHLLWAGLGATMALVVCMFGTMSVLHAASVERPDSFAGVLESLANPGSDRNPMLLDGRLIQAPRAVDDTASLDQLTEDEAVFALAAVVTREGRISNYTVLPSDADEPRFHAAARQRHVTSVLDKFARSRFIPAEQGVARAPVAVNMVWLLARTTVYGTHRELTFNPARQPEPEAAPVLPASKPVIDGTNDTQAATRPHLRPAAIA
jgi:hypothetical protein